ncbi:unnamed protein product [Diatraea saccharalis]|uniref:Ig-like domain-containing protein n=1 Tax=Diatraea saccharalis TaxID=40085 RepID=A0A9N9QVN5_9NEOP|nr:unnamed protein product [Diatraea saccharalis]
MPGCTNTLMHAGSYCDERNERARRARERAYGDPPVVRLRLGSSLAAGDIKEGDDVYFECHVRANPPARKLSWLHDDRPLAHNATARVFHSNQSLVLQKVTRHSSGRYACSALNAEGETVSNELHFRVKCKLYVTLIRLLEGAR